MYDFNSLVAEAYMEAIKELLSSEMFVLTWDIGHSHTWNNVDEAFLIENRDRGKTMIRKAGQTETVCPTCLTIYKGSQFLPDAFVVRIITEPERLSQIKGHHAEYGLGVHNPSAFA